jgi:hypothetical protein
MQRIFVKPRAGLKVRKTQAEQFKHYKDEGEEVNKSKEVVRLLKYGDLVPIKSTKKKAK